MPQRRVVVVGGGVTGLAAAHTLSQAGGDLEVTVLEASDRLGGAIKAIAVEGHALDVGATHFDGLTPAAAELVAELGLDGALLDLAQTPRAVLARGQLRDLPTAMVGGVPTSWRALRRSKLLTRRALWRVGLDVVAPRHDLRGRLGDRAVGPLLEQKLGREVVEVVTDPLLGGRYGGHVADLSAAAAFPALLDAAGTGGSVLHALRAAEASRQDASSSAVALRGTMASLPSRLASQLEDLGASLLLSSPALALRRGAPGEPRWTITTGDAELEADGLVLAVPAAAAEHLLVPVAPEAAGLLHQLDAASVVVVTLRTDAEAAQGIDAVVPARTLRSDGERFCTTAVRDRTPETLAGASSILQLTMGRIDDRRALLLDDAGVRALAMAELAELCQTEVTGEVLDVTRWIEALPQYRVNHRLKVSGIEAGCHRLPALAVAGAGFHGIDLSSCIESGQRAAHSVAGQLRAFRGIGHR